MKPLHMPMVEPEKSDIGFWPGVRSVYVNDSRDRTLGNWVGTFSMNIGLSMTC